MTRRYYSSTAQRTTLSAGISNSATSIPIVAATGLPSSYPYTMIIAQDTAAEEVIEVTNRVSLTLTATRGVDGTTAVSHNSGDSIAHGFSGRDFEDISATRYMQFTSPGAYPYTLVLGDDASCVDMNSGTANTLYVPTNASVAFSVGTTIMVAQSGAGQTTITAVTPGTTSILGTPGVKLRAQYSMATLIKRSADVWWVTGDVVA